jgi:hypothetical protein
MLRPGVYDHEVDPEAAHAKFTVGETNGQIPEYRGEGTKDLLGTISGNSAY